MMNEAPHQPAPAQADYISMLHERLVAEHEGMPKYVYTRSGPPHMPTHICKAEILYQRKTYKVSCEGSRKQTAKNAASKALWERLPAKRQ